MTSVKVAAHKLRVRYAEGLPAKWRVIEEALAQLRAGDADAEATLRRIAHQIRGSAASFGFLLIDKAASRLEHAENREVLAREASELIKVLRSSYESESTPLTRVLLIDDDPEIGFMMNALLAEDKLAITQVTTAAAAIDELESSAWKLIFVDLVLPDADGRTLLTKIRALPLHRDTTVVVLSAKTGSLVKNECAVYGVDDFIEKPIDLSTFAGRVSAMLERTRAPEALTHLDPLTGLPNRLGFRTQLAALAPSQRTQLSLAILELEQLELYVRRAGQGAADKALIAAAKLLRGCLRDGDLLGRWGGGEFLVALPGVQALEAIALLGKASESLKQMAIGADSGPALTLTAGVTELGPNESLDLGLLRADQLLRRVKRSGSSRWYAHTNEPGKPERPRILIAEDDPALLALLLDDLSDDFDVHWVADGAAAMAAAMNERFELVLLDYQMPELDGVEVTKRLRQHPNYRETPILLLTAVGSDAAVEAAFTAGADDYISKPHRRRALLARLARHLGRSLAHPEPREHAPSTAEAIDTTVTAMFCDISGFTSMAEGLSPREVLHLLNTYFPVIAKLVTQHGGKLEKYIGDAVLAIWGAPRASERDVVDALEASVAIQQAVSELDRKSASTSPLRVHIGLHTGPVVAARIGSEGLEQFATVGDTTNVASRICDQAGPGEIVLSRATVTALAGRCRWAMSAPVTTLLDGRDEPVETFKLLWEN
jgi:diguanylate cyclase (GGDEF)-like protein